MSDPSREEGTVTADGTALARLPEGVHVRDLVTHVDDRGSLCEMYDPRWDVSDEPVAYSYFMTIRPGVTKGWALHRRKMDRYVVPFGEVEVVLYDARDGSPTHGLVAKHYLTELRRQTMTIPPGIWHATRNVGPRDAVVVNFPNELYDHADPDKYHLPLDTDAIPYSFD
jgi:dTDP-4-dehydrorhamnose 3,5-epimerase